MDKADPNQWWQIRCDVSRLTIDEVEELGFRIISGFCDAGTAQDSENELLAYIRGTREQCDQRLTVLRNEFSFEAEIEAVEEKNWVATSLDSWEKVSAADLLIVPFLETSAEQPPAGGEIRIHPGTGFGTGHHATTRMLLLLLQDPLLKTNPPESVLDLGTGSGVLAIAAHRLYGLEIDAIDNDPMAIDNAILNTQLNHCEENINLQTGTINDAAAHYGLIIANLYAELLIELAQEISERTRMGGTILLSGILQTLWPEVKKTFIDCGCSLQNTKVSTREFNNNNSGPVWMAACFTRGSE